MKTDTASLFLKYIPIVGFKWFFNGVILILALKLLNAVVVVLFFHLCHGWHFWKRKKNCASIDNFQSIIVAWLLILLGEYCLLLGWLLFSVEEAQEMASDDSPEKNPQYTTVYVGNLAPEARIHTVFWLFFTLLIIHIYLGVLSLSI